MDDTMSSEFLDALLSQIQSSRSVVPAAFPEGCGREDGCTGRGTCSRQEVKLPAPIRNSQWLNTLICNFTVFRRNERICGAIVAIVPGLKSPEAKVLAGN
jgi:hypothetical protein